MEIIIRVDDFGFSEAVNLGVMKAYQSGLVKNIGLMSNMPYAPQAAKWIQGEQVALGLHTNLILGFPCSDPKDIPSLADESGRLISSCMRRKQWAQGIDGFDYFDARRETEAQLDAFIKLVGRHPDYIDVHAVCTPSVTRAISDAADAYGIAIQAHKVDSRWKMIESAVNHAAFYALHRPYSEFFTSYLTYGAKANLVVFHPGYLDQDVLLQSSLTSERCFDLALLCDEGVKEFLSHHTLLSFKELPSS